jgi:branched-chain amino acid aminotransferase
LRQAFFGLFDGRTEDRWGWLQHVGGFEPERTDQTRPAPTGVAA